MSTIDEKKQTPIKPVIPPDAPYLVKVWYKYFVFQAAYWRLTMFVLLIISVFYLWPYAAIVTDGKVATPVQTLETKNDAVNPTVTLTVIADQYLVPGKPAKFEFYLSEKTSNAENVKVEFKVIPTSSNISFPVGEAVLREGDKGIWQATSIVSPVIPQNFADNNLPMKIQVEIVSDEDAPPVTLEIKDVKIPVVRWPSYVVQLVLFLASFGFFSLDQLGTVLRGLLPQGATKK